MPNDPGEVTRLLIRISRGHRQSMDELIPIVYAELRRIAARSLAAERPGHTLQPTALVHEAYMRLAGQHDINWQNREHFFAIAAQLMRRILLDHARRAHAAKRGGHKVTLDENMAISDERLSSLVIIDEALTRLAAIDPDQARLVELRFFGGLSVEETGQIMKLSSATVKREWHSARAWLLKEMAKAEPHDSGAMAAG